MITSNKKYNASVFLKNHLQAFFDEKSFRTVSRLMSSKISFSMLHIDKPFHLSYNIVDFKQFLNSSNMEKLLSVEHLTNAS